MASYGNLLSTLVLAGLAASCGGGGASGPAQSGPTAGDAPPPVQAGGGLPERAPLAPLKLPAASATGIPGAAIEIDDAWPGLPAFEAPLFVAAQPGAGRLWVLEQAGRILAFEDRADATTARVLLDLRDRVLFEGEQGLLGLAFDPAFPLRPFVYVHYSVEAPRRSRIARLRWVAEEDRIDPGSELVLLEQPQPFPNHNGGMLAFGPDDMLYIAFGDGGSGGDPLNHGQDPATLHGALLRIDVSAADATTPYRVPADNPFVDRDDFRPEIWALGLRNPFRFSFDRQTGELWLGDVGQASREEIDLVRAGDNLGWRRFEGGAVHDAATGLVAGTTHRPPVLDYGREDGVAVIGGYVYRGTRLPELLGRYLYTDFASGTVWALTAEDGVATSNVVVARAESPTSFGEDRSGELLMVSRAGRIGRLVAASATDAVPVLLSETGLFVDLATLTPASGLVEYDVRVPFWSDGTRKRRWFAVPDDARIGYDALDAWALPPGSVAVKHFEIDVVEDGAQRPRRLETRVLVHGDAGWAGYTWRWRDDGSDAELLAGRRSEILIVPDADGGTATQRYDFPSRTDCMRCHTAAAGTLLGLRTPQLARTFPYADGSADQIDALAAVDYLAPTPEPAAARTRLPRLDDAAQPVADRARAVLAVNCAPCHRPDGPTPAALDLRYTTADGDLGAIDVAPTAGDLGIANARLVAPGDPDASVLLQRMARTDGTRMPPLSSHVVDAAGVDLVRRWIEGL